MSLTTAYQNARPREFESCWQSPSNIAFIKYWGKKGHQTPANPSLSMTLKECFTETKVKFAPADELKVELFLDREREDKFAAKIQKYLQTIAEEIPVIKNTAFSITTRNTFPHGTGIASSASGLSAFALCLTDYLRESAQEETNDLFYLRASHLSRLASGSACRSVYGGFTTWGESHLPESSDKYATPFEVHSDLKNLRDSVLVVSGEEKEVSSTQGHGKMKEHFFAEARFHQAKENFKRIVSAMKAGDIEEMGSLIEIEALSLHAMMMTSPEPFTLLKPNSLTAMDIIRKFRKETQLPLYFTLDAGPNLHLIYPEFVQHKIKTFISHELSPLCATVIHDERGEGPKRC